MMLFIGIQGGGAWTFNADAVRLPHHAKTKANYREGLLGSGHADTPLRAGKVPESWWPEEKGNGFSIAAKQKKQYIGYPTQKPDALLDRIIRASSNPGDMILDPFCGCATALVAADRLDRQWVGIDLSPMAARLVLKRLREDRGPLFDDVHHREDIPARSDLGELPNYRTHKHTLYGRQEGICAGCRMMFPFRNMTVDHIVPRAKGGQDNLDNLQLLCGACNSMKGAGSHEQLIARLKQEGIRP